MISEETRERLRLSHRGKKQSLESIEKRRQKLIGHKVSEETRRKIGLANHGRKPAPQTIEAARLANLGRPGYWTGKKRYPDTIEKMRIANIGKVYSEEIRQKLRKENSVHWKGNGVGNRSLHYSVRTVLPQPELCQFCNVNKSRDLANVTYTYSRELRNWNYLCRKCHKEYDRFFRFATRVRVVG